ncbi:MAG: hypothetical protein Q4C30_09635 [Bacteroidia bacterium]|nr:hypothetical protein [Bacteroidia bacterium]
MKKISRYEKPELVFFEKDLSVYTTSTYVNPNYGYVETEGNGHQSNTRPQRPTKSDATSQSTGINDYNPFQ